MQDRPLPARHGPLSTGTCGANVIDMSGRKIGGLEFSYLCLLRLPLTSQVLPNLEVQEAFNTHSPRPRPKSNKFLNGAGGRRYRRARGGSCKACAACCFLHASRAEVSEAVFFRHLTGSWWPGGNRALNFEYHGRIPGHNMFLNK